MACKDIKLNNHSKQEVMEVAIHLSLSINELVYTKLNVKRDLEKAEDDLTQ